MLYIRLFHGRSDPAQDMDDWGTDGPVFGPYKFVHTTYKNYLRLCNPDDAFKELFLSEDLLFYDGIYYGDWSVISEEVFEKSGFTVTDFKQAKANLPENEN
jgi:hypothetical protein